VAHTLHLTNAWHAASGGVRTFYTALLDGADRAGRRVTVVVPGERDSIVDVGARGRLYTIEAPASPVLDRRYRAIMPHQFLTAGSAVRRILAREQPDLLEVSDKYTLVHVAGLIKRQPDARPTVVGLTHERFDDALRAHVSDHRMVTTLARRYLATIYMRQFDAHIANSPYTAEELVAAVDGDGPSNYRLWRLRDRIHTLRLGTDVSRFGPSKRSASLRASLIARAGGGAGTALVVFAGRLSKEKHAHWIVPAVAAARAGGCDLSLAVAGDGPLQAAIARDAASALPGRVLWLGHIAERDALAALLASADAFLHPNPREPFGLGPLEAMASATPVVLPRAGGVLSYATDDNSWLAPPDPAGLGRTLADALSQPERARVRVEQALVTARSLDWSVVVPEAFQMYDWIHAERLARQRDERDDGYSPSAMPLMAS
jgi:alpha-1,6-mannosyltransferase